MSEHIKPLVLNVLGILAVVVGFVSDALQLAAAGLPWSALIVAGALVFSASTLWLSYRLYGQASLRLPEMQQAESPSQRLILGGYNHPDVSLFEAIHWQIKGQWMSGPDHRFVLPRMDIERCVAELLKMGQTGQLTLWGAPSGLGGRWSRKAIGKSKLEKILPEYLKFCQLRVSSVDDSNTVPLHTAQLSPRHYSELMLNAQEVMSLWPRRPK